MNTITIIYKNYENDTFSVKTLGNIEKAIAFTLREEIDSFVFIYDPIIQKMWFYHYWGKYIEIETKTVVT